MASVNLSDYKNIYLQTAKEYISNMSKSAVKLTSNPLDKEAINSLHISSHSLKSQSQVMGYSDIANICLNIEKISDNALKGNVQLTDDIIVGIQKPIKQLEEMLKQV